MELDRPNCFVVKYLWNHIMHRIFEEDNTSEIF